MYPLRKIQCNSGDFVYRKTDYSWKWPPRPKINPHGYNMHGSFLHSSVVLMSFTLNFRETCIRNSCWSLDVSYSLQYCIHFAAYERFQMLDFYRIVCRTYRRDGLCV